MAKSISKFQVKEGAKVELADWPTLVDPLYSSPRDYQTQLMRHTERMSTLQNLLYAANQHALLLIFQGMDAAGKDSAIKHVMSGVNPQGCQVYSFAHPSATELKHDFLWRAAQCLPERGRIGIFNRSYYEEVLIVRVHPDILLSEHPVNGLEDSKTIWERRFQSITNFEKHLHHNGTRIVKFFLHLSKEEQRKRFLARIDDPQKNWKFTQADMTERAFWDDYRKVYEQALAATSTRKAPWHVVPADDKKNARLIISHIIVKALEKLKHKPPQISPERAEDLRAIHKQLLKE